MGSERNDNFLGNGTEQSETLSVCVQECVQARDGGREQERMRERERKRDGNIGKQSFNGAENKENGKKEGGKGEETLCCVQSKNEIG